SGLYIVIRRREYRRVAQVKGFRPELKIDPFAEPGILEHRKIQTSREVGAQIGMRAAQVSKGVVLGDLELGGVVPAIDRADVNPRVNSRGIGPLIAAEREAVVRRLAEDERLTGVDGEDAVRLPAAENCIRQPVHACAVALAFAEGQLIIEVEYRAVRNIVRAERAFAIAAEPVAQGSLTVVP